MRLAVARGLVVSRSGPGGGVFLADASTRMRRSNLFAGYKGEETDTHDYLDLRDALEPLVCREAASNCDIEDARAFRALLARMHEAFDDPGTYLVRNWNLHRRVAQCVQNPPLHSIYLVVLDAPEVTLASVPYDLDSVEQHLAMHAELVEALVAGDPPRLEVALQRHAAGPLLATHAPARLLSAATPTAPTSEPWRLTPTQPPCG